MPKAPLTKLQGRPLARTRLSKKVTFDLSDDAARVNIQYVTDPYEFQNIQAPLPAFIFGHKGLGPANTAG